MNKILKKLAIFCIPLILGIMVYNIVDHPKKSSGSGALGAAHSSIKELSDKSLIIVKGTIGSNSVEKKVSTIKFRQYDFEIKEIIKNKGNVNFKSNGKIKISEAITMGGIPVEGRPIKKGEYMLFLNVFEAEGENYYVNNSINNLYKYEDGKYVNVAVDREKYEAEAKAEAKEKASVNMIDTKSDEVKDSNIPLLEFTEDALSNIER